MQTVFFHPFLLLHLGHTGSLQRALILGPHTGVLGLLVLLPARHVECPRLLHGADRVMLEGKKINTFYLLFMRHV